MDRSRAFLASIAVSWALVNGCAKSEKMTVCDQAVEKYKGCKFEVSGDENLNCTGQLECVSKCALAATCDEIKVNENNQYRTCSDNCQKIAQR